MPLYEYQCDACGHRFEVIQKFADAPIGTCPVCQGAVTKLFSSPAIQFKGSGWYITDYARAGKSDGSNVPADKGGSSSESTSADGKTAESTSAKSEAKSDAKSSSATPAPKAT